VDQDAHARKNGRLTALEWHHLEVWGVVCGHIPGRLASDIHNTLRLKPVVIFNSTHRDPNETRTCRIFAIDPSTARWTKVPCVDVAAVGLDRKAASVTLDLDILSLEEGEGHVPSARRPLAILAVTLARADRLTTKRESDRATKAATRSEWLFRHGMTFHLVRGYWVSSAQ
jgi:hypothetical protein